MLPSLFVFCEQTIPRWFGLSLALLGSVIATQGQVVLNEIMANNEAGVPNGVGFPDYVELLNRSTEPVALAGWSLTDEATLPRRFMLPDLTLPAGGRLVVWCAVLASGPGVYSGFGLGAGGDQVLLFDPQGQFPVDEVTFGLQAEDLSLGRIPDGNGAWNLNRPSPLAPNEEQPRALTPTVRINEWLARPATGEDWLELYNADDQPASLSGMVLTDNNLIPPNNRPIPALSFLAPRGFVQMFASDLKDPDADHLDFKLGAGGETLSLFGADRTSLVDRITFGPQSDNTSQGRVPDGGDHLSFFAAGSPTPGQPNAASDIRVVINEILSHADPPFEDAIELHNPTTEAVDLSHWWLSDSLVEPRKYRLPPGTSIAPGGFVVYYDAQFGRGPNGFSLNSYEGDRVVLSAGDANGELTGPQATIRFGALKNGVSLGRFVTSIGADLIPLTMQTFGEDQPTSLAQFRLGKGKSNSPARIGPVVINEVHFQPAETGDDEFIELHNPTDSAVRLFDPDSPTNTWRLRDGVNYDFAYNITIPPGGFVIVAGFHPQQNSLLTEFRARYGVPVEVPVYGPFTGRLSDTGEVIDLLHPDKPEGLDSPNAGFVPYEVLERIRYSGGTPWPNGSVGTSLQRTDPKAYGNEPLNWFTASPTPGRANRSAQADSDGDGMPDDWEQANGLKPNEPSDATEDADGDQASNRDEFLAGTDPRDALSRFWVAPPNPIESDWELTFQSVAGRSYSVDFRPVATPGTWQSLTNLPPREISGMQTVRLSLPDGDQGFLRLTTPSPP